MGETLEMELMPGRLVAMNSWVPFVSHTPVCDGWGRDYTGTDWFHLNLGWGYFNTCYSPVPGFVIDDGTRVTWSVLQGYVYGIVPGSPNGDTYEPYSSRADANDIATDGTKQPPTLWPAGDIDYISPLCWVG